DANLFYVAIALIHPLLGGAALAAVIVYIFKSGSKFRLAEPGMYLFYISAGFGIFLALAGMTRPHNLALYAHVATGLAAVLFILLRLRNLAKAARAGRRLAPTSDAASFDPQVYSLSAGVMMVSAFFYLTFALAFADLMQKRPIRESEGTPEGQNGLGCMSCHSIVHVKDSMGQGGFVMEYPPLDELASSKNPVLHWLHNYAVLLDPKPHRNA